MSVTLNLTKFFSQSVKQGNHNSTNAQSSLPETGHSDSEQSIQLLGSIFLLLGGALVAKQSHKNLIEKRVWDINPRE